mgnify:CR=1 FL=1
MRRRLRHRLRHRLCHRLHCRRDPQGQLNPLEGSGAKGLQRRRVRQRRPDAAQQVGHVRRSGAEDLHALCRTVQLLSEPYVRLGGSTGQ